MPREQPPHDGGGAPFDVKFVLRVFGVFATIIVVLVLLIVFGPQPDERLRAEADYRMTPHLVAAAGGVQLWKAYDAQERRWVYFSAGGATYEERRAGDPP